MNIRYREQMYLRMWKHLLLVSEEVKVSSCVPQTPVAVPQWPAVQAGSTEVWVVHLHLVGHSVELFCAVLVWSQRIPFCSCVSWNHKFCTCTANCVVLFPPLEVFDTPMKHSATVCEQQTNFPFKTESLTWLIDSCSAPTTKKKSESRLEITSFVLKLVWPVWK